jgi:flagellar motor protein MotB
MMLPNAVRIATVHFQNGSSRLNNTDLQVLRKVIALQRQNGGVIQIIGHASSRTRAMAEANHKKTNYTMSVMRADTIAKAMIRLGAPKNGIMVGAVSDTQPLYYEVMPTGEAGNRRAEIFISG